MTNDELIEKVRELEGRISKLESPKARSGKKPATTEGPTPVGQVRDAFLGSFRNKFGHEYAGWGARENGMASSWLKSIPLERALEYATIYPHWKDVVVTRSGHPFSLLVQRYVQLDAHMKRHADLVRDLIEAKARDNVHIQSQVKDCEIRIHADREQEKSNPLIGSGLQGQVQIPAKHAVPGTHCEPTRPLRLVAGDESP